MANLVTLVTGGASGIGAALCRRLAAPGRKLLVHTGHRREKAEALAASLRQEGAEVLVAVSAFDDGQALEDRARALVGQAVAQWGRVDHLVHLAGFADRRSVGTLDGAGFRASMAGNAESFFHLATAALPVLPDDGVGRIVAASSFLATRARFGDGMLFPATSAAKAAIEGLVRALAVQVAPRGITVNAVAPGFIAKEAGQHTALDPAARARVEALIPVGRYGQPDDVAGVIAFLLGREAAYVTGQTIGVDGGLTL